VYNSKEAREDNLATLPAIREAILDTTQMMHLYQTHFEELAKNFGAGAISALDAKPIAKPRLAHDTGFTIRCTDTRKPEGVPEMTQRTATQSPFDPEKFAADALNRAFSPSAPCSFAHLHRSGIVCAICGHLEMRAPA